MESRDNSAQADAREAEHNAASPVAEPRHLPPERPGAPGGRRDRNRRARVAAIFDGALALFLEHGIENVTIDDIVVRAGIAKGSFYRYVANKEELVERLLAPLREQVLAGFARADDGLGAARDERELKAAYASLGLSLMRQFAGAPEVVRLYLQENRAPATGDRAAIGRLAQEVAAGAIRLTQVAQQHLLLRRLHPEVTALAVVGAVERLLHGFLTREVTLEPVVVLEELVSMVLDGLRANPPR